MTTWSEAPAERSRTWSVLGVPIDSVGAPEGGPLFGTELLWIVPAQAVILWSSGLYKGLWRFASIPDLLNIIRAAILGALVIGLGLFLINRLQGIPRAVLVLYPAVLSVRDTR